MNSKTKPCLNFTEMSAEEYAKQCGVSASIIRQRCEKGLLDAFKLSDGLKNSHWRIKVPKTDTVDIKEYELLRKENIELHNTISNIFKLIREQVAP